MHYAFGFRGTWVSKVNRTWFAQLITDEWQYQGPMDKAPTAVRASAVQKTVIMTCMPDMLEEVTDIMEHADESDETPMFPNYSTRWATKIVKAAANKFDWDHMLNWSGSHCLRHGSAVQAAGPEGDPLKAAKRIGTTPQNALRYMITNADRKKISALRALGLGGPPRRGPKSQSALAVRAAVVGTAQPKVAKEPLIKMRVYTKKCVQKKRREALAKRVRMTSAKKAKERASGKR